MMAHWCSICGEPCFCCTEECEHDCPETTIEKKRATISKSWPDVCDECEHEPCNCLVAPEPKPEHVCKPSCHNPCLLDDYNPYKRRAEPSQSGERELIAELCAAIDALVCNPNSVDAWKLAHDARSRAYLQAAKDHGK